MTDLNRKLPSGDTSEESPPTDLVVIGDSNASGVGDPYLWQVTDSLDLPYSPDIAYRGYSDFLANDMASAKEGPFRYANLAVAGARISDILGPGKQVDEALARKPQKIVISAGGNDLFGARAPKVDELARTVDSGIRRLRENGAQVAIVLVQDISNVPFLRFGGNRAKRINEKLKEIGQRRGCTVIDPSKIAAAYDLRSMSQDRIHYNEAGHYLIYLALRDKMTDKTHGFNPRYAEKRRPKRRENSAWFLKFVMRSFLNKIMRKPGYTVNATPKLPGPITVRKPFYEVLPTQRKHQQFATEVAKTPPSGDPSLDVLFKHSQPLNASILGVISKRNAGNAAIQPTRRTDPQSPPGSRKGPRNST